MHYFIDGYNLLFRILHAGEDLRTQRDALIRDLAAKAKFLDLDITLVFDSQYQTERTTRSHLGVLQICYTDHGQTADEFILHAIKESPAPAQETIITSDNHLAWHCRRRLAKTESVESFIKWLNKRCKNKLAKPAIPERKLSPLLPPPAPTKTSKAQKEELPHKNLTPEECANLYLDIFEKAFQEEELKTPAKLPKKVPPRISKSKKNKFNPPTRKADPLIPDSIRWQQAFERDLQDEN